MRCSRPSIPMPLPNGRRVGPASRRKTVPPEAMEKAKKQLVEEACAPFDSPVLRDALTKAKQDAEQIIDGVTIDQVTAQGFDAAAKEKATSLLRSFRAYIDQHRAEIDALQILYSRPYKQRLTEPMLKELEKKLRENHAAWTEDRLWDAYAVAAPGKVKGRSQPGRFADLVSLVRFALEQQPVLAPFAESVNERFNEWLTDKAKAGTTFTPEQLAWLKLIRDHVATSLSIETDDLDLSPFTSKAASAIRPVTSSSATNCPSCSMSSINVPVLRQIGAVGMSLFPRWPSRRGSWRKWSGG
jgi:type I restriction enzyme, R subunit